MTTSDEFDDFYTLLKIAPSVTIDEVERAYLRAVKYWHPDNYVGSPKQFQEEAAGVTVKLNLAYELFKDPERRAIYDEIYSEWKAALAGGEEPSRAEVQPPESGEEPLISRLREANLEIVDRRSQSGALWVIGGQKLGFFFKALEVEGYRFKYSDHGGRSTDHQPAWYLSGKI